MLCCSGNKGGKAKNYTEERSSESVRSVNKWPWRKKIKYIRMWTDYFIGSGEQVMELRLMVSLGLREIIMEENHLKPWAGHPGVERTLTVIKGSYYWPVILHHYLRMEIDNFMWHAEGIPLKGQKAVALIEQVIAGHGAPKRLLTDQGMNFESKLFVEVCKALGIKKLQTTAYYLESNGMVEWLHRTITDSKAQHVRRDGKNWDRWSTYGL